MPSLLLGTAQWGLDYGITNTSGRISDSELMGILRLARDHGIGLLDTAPAYGDAELRLREVGDSFCIQTKVSGSELEQVSIPRQVETSLLRMKRPAVESVLAHDWSTLAPEQRAETRQGLIDVKDRGLARAIGVSIYEPRELESLIVEFPEATVVQAPVSVLDHRILHTWRLGGSTFAGTALQARSVFLQGALLSRADQMPFGAHPAIESVREAARSMGSTPLELGLAFVKSRPEIDQVVLGVTSEAEFAQLLDAWDQAPPPIDWSTLESSDLTLLDPRTWTRPI